VQPVDAFHFARVVVDLHHGAAGRGPREQEEVEDRERNGKRKRKRKRKRTWKEKEKENMEREHGTKGEKPVYYTVKVPAISVALHKHSFLDGAVRVDGTGAVGRFKGHVREDGVPGVFVQNHRAPFGRRRKGQQEFSQSICT
jgi:hypothetical protein